MAYSARVGFTFEDLPEGNPLHGFDGEFWIEANIDPGSAPTRNHPGDPPEIEIIDAHLFRGTTYDSHHDCDISKVHEMQRAILALIHSDKQVCGRVYEALWERYHESRMLRKAD